MLTNTKSVLPESVEGQATQLFKDFDAAISGFIEATFSIRWEGFLYGIQDIHKVPLTLIASITECSICLGRMQNFQPSIPLYSTVRTLMESSYKFRYLATNQKTIELHTLQLLFGAVNDETHHGDHWSKTRYYDREQAQNKSKDLNQLKKSLESTFKKLNQKPKVLNSMKLLNFYMVKIQKKHQRCWRIGLPFQA